MAENKDACEQEGGVESGSGKFYQLQELVEQDMN